MASYFAGGWWGIDPNDVYDGGRGGGDCGNGTGDTIREVIASILGDSVALAGCAGTRIYYGWKPQNAVFPSISFKIRDRSYGHNLNGPNATSVATVDFRVASLHESATDKMSRAVRNRFDGLTGTFNTVVITRSILGDESDEIQWPRGGGGTVVYIIDFSCDIMHRVSLPTLEG